MKIAVWHNLPSGGGKRALYYHVRGLVERGHIVESWCLDTADRACLPLTEFGPEHVCRPASNHRSTNLLTRTFAPDYHRAIEQMRLFDDACKRCADEIEAGQFDLLFANSGGTPSLTSCGTCVCLGCCIYRNQIDTCTRHRQLFPGYRALQTI